MRCALDGTKASRSGSRSVQVAADQMQFAAGGQQGQRYDHADEDRKSASQPVIKKQKH